MKKIFLFILIFSSLSVFCQNNNNTIDKISIDSIFLQLIKLGEANSSISESKKLNKKKIDTDYFESYTKAIKIIKKNNLRAALFINSIFAGKAIDVYGINPHSIDSIRIENDTITIGKNTYYGIIYFFSKSPPLLLTLEQVKEKYEIKNKNKSIFMIDGDFIQGDALTIKIDPNNIWKVLYWDSDTFNEFKDKKSPKFTIINILTKTEDNMREKIRIR